MSQFGAIPFGGQHGPFGGPGLISVLGLVAAAINELIVVYDVPPLADDPEGWNSGTNVRNYVLTALDPSVTTDDGLVYVPAGEYAPSRQPTLATAFQDEENTEQVHLTTHVRLDPGVMYEVAVNAAVRGEDCEVFNGPTTWQARAPWPGPPRVPRYVQQGRYRDWETTLFPTDPRQPEATWRYDDNGDIGLHDEDESLKKRILRRIMAMHGEYAHAPTYGGNVRVKALANTGRMQELSNAIAEQVRLEPDVLQASAEVTKSQDLRNRGIVQVKVFVRRSELRDSRFLYELAIV